MIGYHHERFEGGGYPHGIAGEEIPLEARIFAVCDTLDAITSDRPYRKGRSLDVAIEEIERCSKAQFDPAVVRALQRCIARTEQCRAGSRSASAQQQAA